MAENKFQTFLGWLETLYFLSRHYLQNRGESSHLSFKAIEETKA